MSLFILALASSGCASSISLENSILMDVTSGDSLEMKTILGDQTSYILLVDSHSCSTCIEKGLSDLSSLNSRLVHTCAIFLENDAAMTQYQKLYPDLLMFRSHDLTLKEFMPGNGQVVVLHFENSMLKKTRPIGL